jgi:hypothetical protein
LRIALPQSGQLQLVGSCTIVSRGRWAGNARGARRNGSARFSGGSWVDSAAGSRVVVAEYNEGAGEETVRLTMASVFLQNHFQSFWEQALVPYAFGLYFTGVNVEAVHSP